MFNHPMPFNYPSEIFKDANQRRVKIPMNNQNLNHVREIVIEKIRTSSLVVNDALVYLDKKLVSIKGKLNSNWESFGITIGLAGEEVNIYNILERIENEDCVHELSGQATNAVVNEGDDKWIVFYIFALLRIVREKSDIHRNVLRKQANQQLRSLGATGIYMPESLNGSYIWKLDQNYRKFVAGFDMLMNKIEDPEWMICRFGTEKSRFAACAILENIDYLNKVLNISEHEIKDSTGFSAILNKQLEIITKPGQEIDKEDSYMPYISEFLGINKSPYSINSNRELYTLIHLVGCFAKQPKSINSKLMEYHDHLGVRDSALEIAFQHFFSTTDKEIMNALRDEKTPPNHQTISFEDWRTCIMAKWTWKIFENFPDTRRETIGDHAHLVY